MAHWGKTTLFSKGNGAIPVKKSHYPSDISFVIALRRYRASVNRSALKSEPAILLKIIWFNEAYAYCNFCLLSFLAIDNLALSVYYRQVKKRRVK